jgi:imidazolonepropionase-like amidohydrolase
MADRGTAWVPTFSPVHFQWRRPEVAGWSPPTIAKLRAILDSHAEHVAMAARLRVNLVAGSDAGSPGVAHGAALIDEIRHFLDCGLTMEQALRAATSLPRRLWGAEAADIARGQRVDLAMLDGDPFDDPVHLGAVAAVLHPDRASAAASEDPRGGL